MVLKYTLKLSKTEAEILRKLKEQQTKFAALPDFWVLYKAYEAFAKAAPSSPAKIPLLKHKLGLWQQPLTSLGKFNEAYVFLVEEKRKYQDKLSFSCGSGIFFSTLGIEVEDRGAKNALFSLSTVYSEWIANASQEELACKLGDILYIASFFQNNWQLYKKIYATLVLNKKAYVANFGNSFTEALLLLFSASTEKKLLPPIKIVTEEFVKTTGERLKSSKKALVLGTSPFYRRIGKSWSYTDLDLELLLSPANKLTVMVAPAVVNTYAAGNLAEAEENKEFEKFIEKYLNDWLNQLLATVNLAVNIYELYKTKILLEQV